MQAPRIKPKRPILRSMMGQHSGGISMQPTKALRGVNPTGAARDGYTTEIRHAQSQVQVDSLANVCPPGQVRREGRCVAEFGVFLGAPSLAPRQPKICFDSNGQPYYCL